jgi:hypothetical protein
MNPNFKYPGKFQMDYGLAMPKNVLELLKQYGMKDLNTSLI